MSNDKVQCRCCGKMMVPRVTYSRSFLMGWLWGWLPLVGHPSGNVCPFCLSENWDNPYKPVPRTPGQKIFLLLSLLFFGLIIAESLMLADSHYFGGALLADKRTFVEWSVILLVIPVYRRMSVTRN